MNQSKYPFGDAELVALRETVLREMSPKRFAHTAAVEDMVIRLATLYCPEEIPALRAAALLHDITKEYDVRTHMTLLTQAGEVVTPGDEFSDKTFHARTAVLLLPDNYLEHQPLIKGLLKGVGVPGEANSAHLEQYDDL